MTLPKFDTYTIVARFFPAVLAALPLFALWHFVTREPAWHPLLDFLVDLRYAGVFSLTLVFLYFYAQLARFAAKQLERRHFTISRGLPTTYFMLYSDGTYSADYKQRFRERVQAMWKLAPLDSQAEQLHHADARSRLDECFAHIRLHVGPGKLVLQHNIWYGFARNLVGGSVFGATLSAANIIVGCLFIHAPALIILSVILLLVYSAIFAAQRPILIQFSEAYARQLIAEFMSESLPPSKHKKRKSAKLESAEN